MKFHAHHRGLSLLETAIVLAIAGAVVAGIWVYAAQAREGAQLFRAQQLTLELVNKIHNGMGARAAFGTPTTDALAKDGMVPPELLRDPACMRAGSPPCQTTHPWWRGAGDGLEIEAFPIDAACGGPTVLNNIPGFIARFNGLPTNICLQLPTRFAAIARDIKFFCAQVNGRIWRPIQTDTELLDMCDDEDIDEVGLVFKVRP